MRITKMISIPHRPGPGQQRLPAVLLIHRVLLEIGLLLVEDKEEKGNWYEEKEIRGRLEVLV